ncbi:hypothetical protein [Salmonella phage vB_SenAc-pSK20]|nr:hypothetical protein PJM36_0121 [Salmonella phage vB_SenM_UTK0005]WRQ13336.1 hypothetical protein [Salmonella phage vB_SenAc-pSK20]
MSVKMKGVEFNAYYNDDEYWVKNAWHDDHCVKVNGEYREELDENIPDDADVIIESGTVYIPVEGENGAEEKDISLVNHFKTWRKQKNFSFIVVTVKKDKLAEVREAMRCIPGVIEVKGN